MMKYRFAAIVSAVALIGAAFATPASATVWNFPTLTGNPAAPGSATWSTPYSYQGTAGTTAIFYPSGSTPFGPSSLWAFSVTSSGCADNAHWCTGSGDIYAKNAGPGEQGLGLTSDYYNNNEISNPYGIAFVTNFFSSNKGMFTSVQLGSVQAGETWSVWGDSNNDTWTLLGSGVGGGVVNFNVPSGYQEIVVSDPSLTNTTGGTSTNNILVESVTTVPEPGTLALLGLGLAGVGFAASRRRKARMSA